MDCGQYGEPKFILSSSCPVDRFVLWRVNQSIPKDNIKELSFWFDPEPDLA